MKTWHYESAFVALILALTVIITGNYNTADILCAFAVWITFMHGQVADRMQEQQAYLIKPSVSCFKWSNRYFLVKEFIWIVFFFMTKHYSAIAGAGLFFLYPFWRRYWIGRKMKANDEEAMRKDKMYIQHSEEDIAKAFYREKYYEDERFQGEIEGLLANGILLPEIALSIWDCKDNKQRRIMLDAEIDRWYVPNSGTFQKKEKQFRKITAEYSPAGHMVNLKIIDDLKYVWHERQYHTIQSMLHLSKMFKNAFDQQYGQHNWYWNQVADEECKRISASYDHLVERP